MSTDNSKNFPLTDEKAAAIKKDHPDAVIIKEKDSNQKTNAAQQVKDHIDKEARDTKNKLRGS